MNHAALTIDPAVWQQTGGPHLTPVPPTAPATTAALLAELEALKAKLAAVEPAPVPDPTLPGELARETVHGKLLVFLAEDYEGVPVISAWELDATGRKSRRPRYAVGRTKATDPVYLAAVQRVHELHADASRP